MVKLLATSVAALLVLTGCAPQSAGSSAPPAETGTQAAVAIGQSARFGGTAIEPVRLIEDSRCPVDATCVWAGRLVVGVAVRSPADGGQREVVLGEPFTVSGRDYVLASATPDRQAGIGTGPAAYRFTFEAR